MKYGNDYSYKAFSFYQYTRVIVKLSIKTEQPAFMLPFRKKKIVLLFPNKLVDAKGPETSLSCENSCDSQNNAT